jgi:pimeloyl-ACP methyl ester carboxylesterase
LAPHRSDRGDIGKLESQEASSVASGSGKSAGARFGGGSTAGIPEATATVAGHHMRYLHSGSGRPVVLVHGLLGYSFSWRFTIPALARDFSVYVPDLLGIGFSERVPGLDYSMAASAGYALEFVDGLGLREFDLVGTSHGGALATLMAAKAGHRIRRLALVAPANPWSGAGRRRIRLLGSAMGSWILGTMFMRVAPVNHWFLTRLYADPARISPGTFEGYAAPLRIPGTLDYLLGVIRNWESDLGRLRAAYEKIRVPTLLVWGDRDPAVLPESAAQVQRAIRGSQLVMMPGVGHLPYEEAPEEFNRVLLEFLRRG